MPLQVFIVLVYGICSWLAIAIIEPVMRSFANEAGMESWLFIAIPGLLAMLFAVLSYIRAATRVTNMEQSMSRALLVALLTWIAITTLIAWLWCPAHSALRCFSNALITTGIVGGGPLLVGAMVAGGIVALVLRQRPSWISFGERRVLMAPDADPNPTSKPGNAR
ncbi:MAG TPA: hypothetical protein VLN25_10865 [Burkholderiaceae bacterium]|jgi:hypothetical protein|nr:hypothetical protein [Burkholderiaceae bacterium]